MSSRSAIKKIIDTVKDMNGDITEQSTSVTCTVSREPDYVKLYLEAVLYITDLPKGYNGILLSCLQHMTYAGGEHGQVIVLNSFLKKGIADKLKVSVARVNQALTAFVKGEIFYRIGRGTFRVNPYLFGRGYWKDIEEIRTTIVFNSEGRTVMSEISKKGDNVRKR